ncbi:conserved hypothetical protein [Hyella patelloides LEGE 07179]|uniref:Uncharacterized protein n=1 Tax=Hyella patelloides LEGE 07179 TaxID=945734 RepID=A0A563W349_9CYAN|nr:hypothetical protein [Hyella patelloides]VEP18134.1 conserved hypothetical protein [Hyella patelloides LEGE 07179]
MQNNSLEDIFKSGQIVCLESGAKTLYGEVIQVIVKRQLCWVRPLTIAITLEENSSDFDINADQEIIDLRSASDLLLPLTLFRASYDTEAIVLLTELASREVSFDKQQMSFSLNSFVRQVWQNNQEKFSN